MSSLCSCFEFFLDKGKTLNNKLALIYKKHLFILFAVKMLEIVWGAVKYPFEGFLRAINVCFGKIVLAVAVVLCLSGAPYVPGQMPNALSACLCFSCPGVCQGLSGDRRCSTHGHSAVKCQFGVPFGGPGNTDLLMANISLTSGAQVLLN